MPNTIVRLKCDGEVRYMEWSSITDSPRTYLMRRGDFEAYYAKEYGQDGMRRLPDRLERADTKGTSGFYDRNLKDAIGFNRAGPFETQLAPDEIWHLYRIERPRRTDPPSPAERKLIKRAWAVAGSLSSHWSDGVPTARALAQHLGLSVDYLFDLKHADSAHLQNGDDEDE